MAEPNIPPICIQILINVTGGHYNGWQGQAEHRQQFLSDYNNLLLQTISTELCLLMNINQPDGEPISIKSLLTFIETHLTPEEDIFLRPEEITHVKFEGFKYIGKEPISNKSMGSEILKLLQKEHDEFSEGHHDNLKILTEISQDLPALTNDCSNLVSAPDFMNDLNLWCLVFSNLIYGLTLEAGVGLYTKQGLEDYQKTIDTQNVLMFYMG